MQKLGKMVLKGVNCVDSYKISSNGLERSQMSTQYINIGLYMVLKGFNWVHNDKIR